MYIVIREEIEYSFKDWRSHKPNPCRAAQTWKFPSVNSQGKHFPRTEVKKQCICWWRHIVKASWLISAACMVTHFSGQFSKISEIYTSKQAYFSTKVFMLTISLQYDWKVILNFRWLWCKSHVGIRFIRHLLILYKSIVLPPIHENLHASSKTAPRYKFGPYMKAKKQFICYWWHIVAISSRHHD